MKADLSRRSQAKAEAERRPKSDEGGQPIFNAWLTIPNVYSNGNKVRKPNVSMGPNELTFF